MYGYRFKVSVEGGVQVVALSIAIRTPKLYTSTTNMHVHTQVLAILHICSALPALSTTCEGIRSRQGPSLLCCLFLRFLQVSAYCDFCKKSQFL